MSLQRAALGQCNSIVTSQALIMVKAEIAPTGSECSAPDQAQSATHSCMCCRSLNPTWCPCSVFKNSVHLA